MSNHLPKVTQLSLLLVELGLNPKESGSGHSEIRLSLWLCPLIGEMHEGH